MSKWSAGTGHDGEIGATEIRHDGMVHVEYRLWVVCAIVACAVLLAISVVADGFLEGDAIGGSLAAQGDAEDGAVWQAS